MLRFLERNYKVKLTNNYNVIKYESITLRTLNDKRFYGYKKKEEKFIIEQKKSSLFNKSVDKIVFDGEKIKLNQHEKAKNSVLSNGKKETMLDKLKASLIITFFPENYPKSTSKGYWDYSKWQFAHNVSSTVTGVLSTQCLLFAMGLGAGSVPVAAALNWVIKDGLGQLGGVVYASTMGDKFDSNPKRHRMWSALAMQGSSLLEIFTPLAPQFFLPLASISNIGKNISWLAASATRAQMNSSFTLKDNLGDITGKTGSQATAAAVVGTMLGVIISPIVGSEVSSCFMAFVPFSYISLYSIYRSNNAVVTRNFDQQRAEILFKNIVNHSLYNNSEKLILGLLPPDEVALKEVFLKRYTSPFVITIEIDKPIGPIINSNPSFLQQFLLDLDEKRTHHLWVTTSPKGAIKVSLWYQASSSPLEVFEGFYASCLLRELLCRHKEVHPTDEEIAVYITQSNIMASCSMPLVQERLVEMGWKLDTNFLSRPSRRINLGNI